MFDVAVVGAGMAGLTAAQQLRQAGYRVVVVDKSRGVGGRVATRRANGTRVDHGLRYLAAQGEISRRLIEILSARQILKVWTDTVYQFSPDSRLATPDSQNSIWRYIAPEGMSFVAKFLALNLEIWFNRRVETIIRYQDDFWQLNFASSADDLPEILTAKALVVAIPAPQALMLMEGLVERGLSGEFFKGLRSIEFDPCITVMAGYPSSCEFNQPWKAVVFPENDDLAWVGLDSSKRLNSSAPVLVIQSSAKFAQFYLDASDLQPAAKQLLADLAEYFQPWMSHPEWLQVHRWRYAFPSRPLAESFLAVETTLPLICCGDWCGGNLIESALTSGLEAAQRVNAKLQNLSLPGMKFLESL